MEIRNFRPFDVYYVFMIQRLNVYAFFTGWLAVKFDQICRLTQVIILFIYWHFADDALKKNSLP